MSANWTLLYRDIFSISRSKSLIMLKKNCQSETLLKLHLFISNLYISIFLITHVYVYCVSSVLPGSGQKGRIVLVFYHFATLLHVISRICVCINMVTYGKIYKCYNSAFLVWNFYYFLLLSKPR